MTEIRLSQPDIIEAAQEWLERRGVKVDMSTAYEYPLVTYSIYSYFDTDKKMVKAMKTKVVSLNEGADITFSVCLDKEGEA
tara:strand:- start:1557 stop:1799 length:243 start_codon:yes stop_codon:yes gene_type:complete